MTPAPLINCGHRRRFSLTFSFVRLRLHFRAGGEIHFPPGKAGNMLRGALGAMLHRQPAGVYARTFAPRQSGAGPSGLSDPPRPFVLRAAHLDGVTVSGGGEFHFDLHLFQVREPAIPLFTDAFAELAHAGLGPARAPAVLTGVEQFPEQLSLDPWPLPVQCLVVRFVTPTELKPALTPEFVVLIARVRDRLSTLSALYASGPLNLDFQAFGERARQVETTRCQLQHVDVSRVSSRTGQKHPLGGFMGEAEYRGDLSEFVPFLIAAQFTGVGRQTTWGKGEIKVVMGSMCDRFRVGVRLGDLRLYSDPG